MFSFQAFGLRVFLFEGLGWRLQQPGGEVESLQAELGAWLQHVSISLNSLKAGYVGDYVGGYYRSYIWEY